MPSGPQFRVGSEEIEMTFVRMISRAGWYAAAAVFAGMLAMPSTSSATTLEDMQAAFNGESNAHIRYLAFAKQADKEGYGEVASLFRAAARAEEIHATNHAAVIKGLGQEPKAKIEVPEVKSTRENLEAAIKGESYERDTMYPQFLKQARSEHNKAAIKSLNYAKQAEEEHAKLYSATLANLDRLKGSMPTAYMVCPKCGFTTNDHTRKQCPTCFTVSEQFEKVA
jgi:rubrerythrin